MRTMRASWIVAGVWASISCGNEAGSSASGSESGSTVAESSGASTGATSTATTTAGTSASTTASTSASTTATTVDTSAESAASSSSAGTDSGALGRGEVRFVALGDAGEGNEAQIAVGQTIATVCEERGCDFALYLGDNFYDTGVDSPQDEQFQTKFEVPYQPVDLTFHITLGNHDYGVIGNEWAKAAHYIAYSEISEKWSIPSEYYSFQQSNAHFVSLDTNRLFWSYEVDQMTQWLQADLAGLNDTWIIMFGHHPYLSNGEHGNAGNYEGLGGILGGGNVQDFFEEEVCGKAHVYLSGHDHNKQWLSPQCGTEFIVSGGGSKLTEFVNRDGNATEYGDDQSEGFLWVEIIDNSFTGVFFDRMGNAQYERTITL